MAQQERGAQMAAVSAALQQVGTQTQFLLHSEPKPSSYYIC
jgi:hypothetical protein